jgi:hypothetical protein
VLPRRVLARYDFFETRNAAKILRATNPDEFADLVDVLEGFRVVEAMDLYIVKGYGNQTDAAGRLNSAFRAHGWAEGSYTVTMGAELVLRTAGSPSTPLSTTGHSTYNIDNLKGRAAIDTEWEAKDGNLDRDLAAYRSLYDAGIIDGAVMVTKNRASLRAWVLRVDPESTKFGGTTTTNLEKVVPRLKRGDAGGCPVLVVAVCDRTT